LRIADVLPLPGAVVRCSARHPEGSAFLRLLTAATAQRSARYEVVEVQSPASITAIGVEWVSCLDQRLS